MCKCSSPDGLDPREGRGAPQSTHPCHTDEPSYFVQDFQKRTLLFGEKSERVAD